VYNALSACQSRFHQRGPFRGFSARYRLQNEHQRSYCRRLASLASGGELSHRHSEVVLYSQSRHRTRRGRPASSGALWDALTNRETDVRRSIFLYAGLFFGVALSLPPAVAQQAASAPAGTCTSHYSKCMAGSAAAASNNGRGMRMCQVRLDSCMATGDYTSADGTHHIVQRQ